MRVLQIFTEVCGQLYKGRVAQSVEQRIENPRVGSSILPPATTILPSKNQAFKAILTKYALPDFTLKYLKFPYFTVLKMCWSVTDYSHRR